MHSFTALVGEELPHMSLREPGCGGEAVLGAV